MGRIILPNSDSRDGVGQHEEEQFHNVLVAMIVNDVLHASKTGTGMDIANSERTIKRINALFVQTATMVWVKGAMEKLKVIFDKIGTATEEELKHEISKLATEYSEAFEVAQENYSTLAKQLKIDKL